MPERDWRTALITFDKPYPPGAIAGAVLGKPLEYWEILLPGEPRLMR